MTKQDEAAEPAEVVADRETLTEYEDGRTQMAFDDGSVPLYVALAWVAFLACYVAYMVVYGLPDFSAWNR